MNIFSLESLYFDSCKRHKVLPNSAILSYFSQAKIQNSCQEKCSIGVSLNQLKQDHISPLVDVLLAVDSSNIDAVDIFHEAPCNLEEEHIMSLLRAVNQKLRVVNLHDIFSEQDFLRDLCHHGLNCQVLNLNSTRIRKLNMAGRFLRLHTLNLDFCTSITSLHRDCFTCMPNLMRLSMCATRVSDLWTTTAALSKLPSLSELRFQNCTCCKDTRACPESCCKKRSKMLSYSEFSGALSSTVETKVLTTVPVQASRADMACRNSDLGENKYLINDVYHETNKLSSGSEAKISGFLEKMELVDAYHASNEQMKLQNKMEGKDKFSVSERVLEPQVEPCISQPIRQDEFELHCGNDRRMNSKNNTSMLSYSSHHPSPICFEKHYRDYIIASLPRLRVLDNISVEKIDKQTARIVISKSYEYLPYDKRCKESVPNILLKRELGMGCDYGRSLSKRKSQDFISRSLGAAKFGSAVWPQVHHLSSLSHEHKEGNRQLRPRQFEYHPSDPRLMVLGTLDGEVVVINHENGKTVGSVPSTGAMNSILGLCWLKTYPSKLLAGSDNGCLRLFDVNNMPQKSAAGKSIPTAVAFEDFEPLTSVHANATDDQFITSGYSRDIALYDINSRKRIQLFTNMHKESINVAKFAHHSPFLFATSSFDRDVKLWDLRQKPYRACFTSSSSRANIMVCFSPDDRFLLVSAVDNEVKQISTADGRTETKFEMGWTGSGHNYTRSYYINGGDYIISGSSDEHIVRICSARTGNRLKDVFLEDTESGHSLFVQSLRGDSHRLFHMSVLASSKRPTPKSEIIKVNLMATTYSTGEYSDNLRVCSPSSIGG